MRYLLLLMLILTTGLACTSDNPNASEIHIRLHNVSPYDYKSIVVNTSTGNVNFGDLGTGQNTSYKTFQTAYRYAFVELQIDGATYTLQPIDYVGENPLEHGHYTYEIDANGSQDQYGKLSIALIVD